jgi:hypothetical protein
LEHIINSYNSNNNNYNNNNQANYGNDFGTFMQTYFNVMNQMLKKEKLNHSDLCAIVDAVMNVNLNHHYHIINLFDR